MQKAFLCLLAILLIHSLHAQWTTNGTHIYSSNSGNVGVGANAPLEKLHLGGKLYIESPYLGQGVSSAGPLIRMGDYPYSNYAAGLGITQAQIGVDVLDLDFYCANLGAPLQRMKLTYAGLLGIGTTAPGAVLHVNYANGSGDVGMIIQNSATTTNETATIHFRTTTASTDFAAIKQTRVSSTSGRLDFSVLSSGSPVAAMSIKENGNVGIGSTDPGPYKLAVEGIVGVRKLKVTQVTPWADYVFEPTYQLPSLQHVEQFIKANKHLPDVPSATEVEKEGLDIGANQAVLLKKIEELTLYLIDMQKEITHLKQQLKQR